MVAVLLTTGVLIGIIIAVAIIMIYTAIETRREEAAREKREADRRSRDLIRKLNDPRDPLTRALMDQTRKELKEREEG